jgi:RND superfamily putative drug exporter
MLNLAGEQGQTLANEGVQAVRKVIEDTKAPPGVQAYVAGPAALTDDLHVIGNASLAQITLITLIAISVMLLVVYRSIITTLVQLFLTGIGLLTSRGMVSTLALHDAFGLTTFAGNILTMLAIAAATDYGIFIFGRYREARGSGLDRDDAYYTTFRSVAPVIIGSGLTIAGATYCLSFARRPSRWDRPSCSSVVASGSSNRRGLRQAGSGDALVSPWCVGPHRFSWRACSSC